ncbi:MAG TPA: DNA internalization-related competence protein ComEC/Rec2 [Ignavibacteria bacterium]|nr:DNA internalization-related competence protein ComEC/Rec2 [Ignavibacteria bacterium]
MSKSPALKFILIYISGILCFDLFSQFTIVIRITFITFLLIVIFLRFKDKFEPICRALIFLLIFIMGLFNSQFDFNRSNQSVFKNYPDTQKNSYNVITGIVTEIPVVNKSGVKLVIECRSISSRRDTLHLNGKVIATLRENIYSKSSEQIPVINPGDEISLKGKLSTSPGRRNPGDFDYKKYLESRDIHKLFYSNGYKDVKIISQKNLSFIYQYIIFPAKIFALNNIDTLLSGDNASYLKGLVTGERSDISDETKEAFINAGVMHLIAVSGLNVAYVIIFVNILLSLLRVPFKYRIYITCLFLIFYCMFTGSPASILRATIMGITVLMSFVFERKIYFYNFIGVSAMCLLIFDTRLLFDTGFILSYAATFSMVIIYNRFEKSFLHNLKSPKTKFKKIVSWISVLFFTSLAAQIGTLPLTSLYFGKISFISLLANVVAVPLANISLAIGFLQILTGIISFDLSSIIAETNNILLSIQLEFIKFCAGMKFSFIYIKNFTLSIIISYYIICILLIFAKTLHMFFRNLIISFLIILILLTNNVSYEQKMTVTFLDVGQGDCALIETPDGKNILVDCGNSTKTFDNGEKTIAPLLRRKGIDKIDMIILTHLHMDHIGGVNYLLKHFEIGSIFESGQEHITDFTMVTDSLISINNVKRTIVRSGDMIDSFKDMRLYFLYPDKAHADASDHPSYGNLNNGSVVFILKYRETEILFTGDAEAAGELYIKNHYEDFIDTDVLKAGHHGSITSSTIPFILKNSPRIAVISCGMNNKFNHPSKIILDRLKRSGAEIFRTDNEGAVIIETDGYEIKATNKK